MTSDRIHIKNLKLETRIGVPAEERAEAQTVAVSLTIKPDCPLAGLDDDIGKTIDYFAVAEALKAVAAEGERKLIETLAKDLASAALEFDRVKSVDLEVRKFIIPETDYVSVSIRRERQR